MMSGVLLPGMVAMQQQVQQSWANLRVAHAKEIHMMLLADFLHGDGMPVEGEEWKGDGEGGALKVAQELAEEALMHADALLKAFGVEFKKEGG